MGLFNYFAPFFILFVLILTGWNFLDQSRFTRFEGNLKRGFMVGADPLSWETRQWLETLPPHFRSQRGFMRKEGREVLIVAKEPPLWGIFNRRRQWPYIAYINLAGPESQLEFRTPWSILAIWLGLIPGLFLFLLGDFQRIFFRNVELAWPCVFPFIFFAFLVGSIWLYHSRERKRLLDFLNWAISQKSFNES